ncbi:hypothetical protein, partial [Escherichia coli]|uniref:hypothetical protein n=1 Tax=Escherichia coli TaxID=562 RepID=UPI001BC89F3E
ADRNRSHWSTSKTPSYTKSVSWQHHRCSDKTQIIPVRQLNDLSVRLFLTRYRDTDAAQNLLD